MKGYSGNEKRFKPCPWSPVHAMRVLLLVTFVNMLGFTIVIPVVPFIVAEIGGDPTVQGALVSTFAIGQLASAPLWGLVSDRLGRARVITIGTAIMGVGHLMFALSWDVPSAIASRALGGLGGGTISAVQAMVADLTGHRERTGAMGAFGAMFGLGFVLGPAIGGLLGALGTRAPLYLAAALSLASAAASTTLPSVSAAPSGPMRPRVGLSLVLLLGAVLTFYTAFSQFEALFPYYGAFSVGLSQAGLGLAFMYMGAVTALVQGVLIRGLSKRASDGALASLGTTTLAVGLLTLPYAGHLAQLLASLLAISMGAGLAMPTLFSMASKMAPQNLRGTTMGLVQASSSMGRIIGPLLGGGIYAALSPTHMFALAAALSLTALPLAAASLRLR